MSEKIVFHKRDADRITGRVWCMMGAMLTAGFLFLSFLALKPSENGADVAAIFPPSMTLTEITNISLNIPYRPLRVGFLDNVVIFKPLAGAKLADLEQAGALIVLSAVADGGCVFFRNERKVGADYERT